MNYNRDFIARFAWLREFKRINCDDAIRESFRKVKKATANAILLVVEDSTKKVLIGTDASELGLGFWRGQLKDKYWFDTIERVGYGSN